MYFKKIRPSTTCLYSAASMLLRSLSAVSQSLASNPRFAAVPFVGLALVAFFFAMLLRRGVVSVVPNEAVSIRSQQMPIQSLLRRQPSKVLTIHESDEIRPAWPPVTNQPPRTFDDDLTHNAVTFAVRTQRLKILTLSPNLALRRSMASGGESRLNTNC